VRSNDIEESSNNMPINRKRISERRSYQIGKAKKFGPVFLPQAQEQPHTEIPTDTTPKAKDKRRRPPRRRYRLRLEKGQPVRGSKLTSTLTKRLCALIERHATLDDAARACGISRETVWEWRGRGQRGQEAGEDNAYAAFENAISASLFKAKQTLVAKVADHSDWKASAFILKNRFPNEYRDHVIQEVTGAEGQPLIPQQNPFLVVLELDPRDAPLEEKSFTVEHPDRRRERWQGSTASPFDAATRD
jgi:hypothetical protein